VTLQLTSQSELGVDISNTIVKPTIEIIEKSDTYGKFSIEPLERGLAVTLGNSMRRVLFSSIMGAAITWVKIDGVQHEYSTIPYVVEDVTEFLLNVKAIRLRSHSNDPGRLVLDIRGQGEASAGDISPSAEYEVANPELHLATVDAEAGRLSVEFNVERGRGFISADKAEGLSIGALPVDAIFSPVRKVNYDVENVRIGQDIDKERLILEVSTDGTVTPIDSVREAGNALVDYFFLFANTGKVLEQGAEKLPLALSIPPDLYSLPIDNLGLSARTLNRLKRADINKVGEVLEKPKDELLNIRNFGEKSLQELYEHLEAKGVMPSSSDEEETSAEGEQPIELLGVPGNDQEPDESGDQAQAVAPVEVDPPNE
jgi:DNA-directed RNA polymerase subunit alpha